MDNQLGAVSVLHRFNAVDASAIIEYDSAGLLPAATQAVGLELGSNACNNTSLL